MADFIQWIFSLLFTLPILGMISLFLILRMFVKNKKKSLLLSLDLSTFLFILSVHFHLITIFHQSFILYIILGLIVLTAIFYYIDYKKSRIPLLKRAIKKVWRLSFLFFFACYIFLTIIGIAKGIITTAFL